MERDEIKKQMDQMILKVMQYIRAAGASKDEFYELSIEAACTFITSNIDIEQSKDDCINEYMKFINDVVCVGCGGIIRAKENGDYKYI